MGNIYVLSVPDPKTPSPGSADRHLPLTGPRTQYVPRCQLRFCLYVVFQALIVTCCSAAFEGALLISCAWYTSGNRGIEEKSDHHATGFR